MFASILAFAALAAGQGATAQSSDPDNPTCPLHPNWSSYRQMRFTVQEVPGRRPILLAEGVIDDDLIPRLQAALNSFQGDELWLRSPGGNANVTSRRHRSGAALAAPYAAPAP